MRNNRGQRRSEREFGRSRDFELRQDRERRDNRGRYDWEWRPSQGDERMAEERRNWQNRPGYTRGGRYEDRDFMPEYKERQRWDREDWGEVGQYRGNDERYARPTRDEEDQGFENTLERDRFRRYAESDYGRETGFDGDRREDDDDFGRRQGRRQTRNQYQNGGRNGGSIARNRTGNGGSQSRSQSSGNFGSGERYSSSDRFGGQEYFDGQAGGGDGFSGREQSWTGSNSPQFGESWQQQNHAGKGPRGYQRSDDRIKEDISESLKDHPEIDATEITVQVSQGQVTLTGTVDNRYAKRAAEDAVEEVSGVKDVQNQIRVAQSGETGPSQSMLTTGRIGRESGKEVNRERLGTAST